MEMQLLPQGFRLEGKRVVFLRSDGAPAQNVVGSAGQGPDGEMLFFELVDKVSPILNGKKKFKRLVIRRVFPCVDAE